MSIPQVMIPNVVDRHYPAAAFAEAAKVLEASGVVDYMQTWDQLASFWAPRCGTRPTARWPPSPRIPTPIRTCS